VDVVSLIKRRCPYILLLTDHVKQRKSCALYFWDYSLLLSTSEHLRYQVRSIFHVRKWICKKLLFDCTFPIEDKSHCIMAMAAWTRLTMWLWHLFSMQCAYARHDWPFLCGQARHTYTARPRRLGSQHAFSFRTIVPSLSVRRHGPRSQVHKMIC
jgi:hypothetical protein